MKDGSYAMSFSAGDHSGSGQVSLRKHMLIGRDKRFIVSGQIAEDGNHLIGTVLVIPVDGVPIDEPIVGDFLVPVTGIAEHERFTLIGVGPLGLVVEVACIWQDSWAGAVTIH